VETNEYGTKSVEPGGVQINKCYGGKMKDRCSQLMRILPEKILKKNWWNDTQYKGGRRGRDKEKERRGGRKCGRTAA